MSDVFNKKSKAVDKNKDIVIFLDIDGVIGDFDTHMHAHGKANKDGSPKWNELDYDWWISMPVYKGAKKFYWDLKKIAPVKFLSAPTLSADCYAGKAEWISNKFSPKRGRYALLDLILCPGNDKKYLAGPGRILIDDRIKNIEKWRASGGIGIHHQGDFAKTLEATKKAVLEFLENKAPIVERQPKPSV